MLKRAEEDAAHSALDEVLTSLLGELSVERAILQGMGRASPQKAIVAKPSQGANFATDEVEDFGRAASGHEQTEHLRIDRSGVRLHEGACACAAFDESFMLQVEECSGDRGTRNAVLFDELRFAGELAGGSKFARGDFGAKFLCDLSMFLHSARPV